MKSFYKLSDNLDLGFNSFNKTVMLVLKLLNRALLEDNYLFINRGVIQVKGKGDMNTYFLIGRDGAAINADLIGEGCDESTREDALENNEAPAYSGLINGGSSSYSLKDCKAERGSLVKRDVSISQLPSLSRESTILTERSGSQKSKRKHRKKKSSSVCLLC